MRRRHRDCHSNSGIFIATTRLPSVIHRAGPSEPLASRRVTGHLGHLAYGGTLLAVVLLDPMKRGVRDQTIRKVNGII